MISNSTPSIDNTGVVLSDGRETHEVKIVAAVRDMDIQSTMVNYTVEDGTGILEVKQWMNQEGNQPNQLPETPQENMYVRITGMVKEFNGTRSITAQSIRKVSTGNELTHHMLEVVYSAQKHEKKKTTTNMHTKMPQSAMISPYGMNTSMSMTNSSPALALNMNNQHFSAAQESGNDLHDTVLNFIKVEGEQSDIGADIKECIRSLAGTYSEQQIMKSLSHLSSEGHIYSTVNEESFKCAS